MAMAAAQRVTLAVVMLLALPAAHAVQVTRPWESLRPAQAAEHATHAITSVPGYSESTLPSAQYGGYITVDEDRGRHLYYYFVTSQGNPRTDPVVLWLNGGPGCSSFDGFVNEHGPFSFAFKGGKDPSGRQRQQLELGDNPHTWTKVASIIYVDSPAGVGMSYSETKADYHTNDTHTAKDVNTFLRRWFEEYSEFQDNDFWVAGESYGGVYVPMVTQAVLDGNDAGEEPKLNLQGYIVGNGVTDPEFDGNALVPFARGATLISEGLYKEAEQYCGGAYWNASDSGRCGRVLDAVYGALEGLNLYDVLEPCYHGHNPYHAARRASVQAAVATHRQWPLLGGLTQTGPVAGFGELLGQELAHTPPCLDSREMWAFCNDPEVRQAIHAAPMSVTGAFDECTNGEKIHYTHDVDSMLPVHRDLIERGMQALIYSGDHDMAVPHTGSEAWTAWLGAQLGERAGWAPWMVDGQVAGYAVHYRALVFATVKGAGHMVPSSKPREALDMFARFLRHAQL